MTAFVEAHDVRPAVSGGVKRDQVRHSVADTGGAKEGYGFVPFHRTEYVARDIVAYGTDKVFDPFAALDPHSEIVVRWSNTLDAQSRAVVTRLCGLLPYLGRADSLCQARLLTDEEADQLPR